MRRFYNAFYWRYRALYWEITPHCKTRYGSSNRGS